MDESVVNTVTIQVGIEWDEDARRYTWTYTGPGVDPNTGNFKLPAPGKTAIIYQLDSADYQLLTVNMDPANCATHEIVHIHVHHDTNSITVIDRNEYHYTRFTPFSLRLVARRTHNIAAGFVSPDPQVTTSPNSMCHPQPV
jgi:hypothetical protein